MTKDKALKRDVRARMEKTGEAYTTARHYLFDQHLSEGLAEIHDGIVIDENASPVGTITGELPPRAADPGMSDDAIQRSTGKIWDEWLLILDDWGARERTHAEIARYVGDEFGIGGWWAQNVTVGYERARGMRKVNERTDGYSANASRTFAVPIERLYAAFADDAERATWLEPELIRVRTFTENKVWRCEMVTDDSRVEVRFTAKSPEKTSIAIQQTRLATEDDVTSWRAFWKTRLEKLAAQIS
jgi:hypothetical protein